MQKAGNRRFHSNTFRCSRCYSVVVEVVEATMPFQNAQLFHAGGGGRFQPGGGGRGRLGNRIHNGRLVPDHVVDSVGAKVLSSLGKMRAPQRLVTQVVGSRVSGNSSSGSVASWVVAESASSVAESASSVVELVGVMYTSSPKTSLVSSKTSLVSTGAAVVCSLGPFGPVLAALASATSWFRLRR